MIEWSKSNIQSFFIYFVVLFNVSGSMYTSQFSTLHPKTDSAASSSALKFNINSSFSAPSTSNKTVVIDPVSDFTSIHNQSPSSDFDTSELVYDDKKAKRLHNITREEFVLRRIFDDVHLQNRIMEYLTPDIFTGNHKNIVRGIQAFYNGNKRFPSPQELMIGFADEAPERNTLDTLCSYGIDTVASDISAKMVKNYFREMLTEKIIVEAAVSIKNNKVDNIIEHVKQLERSINFNMDVDIGLSGRKDMAEIIRRLNETLVAVPSALADIRIATETEEGLGDGGWFVGLSFFLGMPNVGKTIMLCNEAAYAYQCGKNVLYVSLEMAEEFIHQRIIANICDIPVKQVKKHKPEDILNRYESTAPGSTGPGQLYVKRMPTTTTVTEIDSLIQEIQRSDNIKIDILIVDYIGIMKPARRANSIQNLNMYLMGKEVAEQLRDLGYKYLIPVLTASQLTREGYANLQASMKDTAGSAAINDVADFMATIMQDPMLRACSMFMHSILKSRFGQNGTSCYSFVDYTHMRVRSASATELHAYQSMLSSQPQAVGNFNRPPIEFTPIKEPEITPIKIKQVSKATVKEIEGVTEQNIL